LTATETFFVGQFVRIIVRKDVKTAGFELIKLIFISHLSPNLDSPRLHHFMHCVQ